MDPKRYFLSMCTCPNRVRVHIPGRTPDYCETCGGWLPPLPQTVDEWEREQRQLAWAYLALGLMALGAAVLAVWLR